MSMNIEALKQHLINIGEITEEEYKKKVEFYRQSQFDAKSKVKELEKKLETATEKFEKANIDEISLEELKELKIRALNEKCNETILGTFTSLDKVFSFDWEAQNNFVQMMLIMQINPTEKVSWKTEDDVVNEFTLEEFSQIIQDANKHKTDNIKKYWSLKEEVNNAETKEAVLEIVW